MVVAYGIYDFIAIATFHINYAMAAVHTGVTCLNGQCNHGTFVVAPYEVVALLERQCLLETETVLNNSEVTQILGFHLLVVAYAHGETLAALLTLEHK